MIEERFVVCVGEGKFAVIAGRQLNDEALSRVEADRVAHDHTPEPAHEAPPPPPKRKPATADNSAATADNSAVEPQPAPAAVDLRTTRADNAGGSCGFQIKSGPSW